MFKRFKCLTCTMGECLFLEIISWDWFLLFFVKSHLKNILNDSYFFLMILLWPIFNILVFVFLVFHHWGKSPCNFSIFLSIFIKWYSQTGQTLTVQYQCELTTTTHIYMKYVLFIFVYILIFDIDQFWGTRKLG